MSLIQADIITAAREITGDKASEAAADLHVTDAAIIEEMVPAVRELHHRFGTLAARAEAFFLAEASRQDYALSELAADASDVWDVRRSGAYLPDSGWYGAVDARTGAGGAAYGMIPAGLQGDVFDVMEQQRRYRFDDSFTWEVVNKSDGAYLRLMPPPREGERVVVVYLAGGGSMATLPDKARSAMVYRAVTAILDGRINKVSSRGTAVAKAMNYSREEMDRFVVGLERQRTYYTEKYANEIRTMTVG